MVQWRPALPVKQVVDVAGPRADGRLVLAADGRLELMQPLDLTLPAASRVNVTRTDEAGLRPASGHYWPHVLLQADRSLFTSVALPLRKTL